MILELGILLLSVDFFSFSVPLWILTILGFIISLSVTYFAIPIIVKGAIYKGLYAEYTGRASHEKPIPVLGGVGIFAGFILSTNVIAGAYFTFEQSYLITALIVIFIVGIKDDLMGGKPWKKLFGQTLAVLIICVLANIRISNLHGFLGIGDIPYSFSLMLTVFVMIVIINGFNLIDGIDGLASGIGILVSFVLGFWFYLTENIACTVMCSALAGGLIAFFNFNVFSQKNKILLGDTGSLTIGLVLGVLVVRFMELEPAADGVAVINSAPAFAVSLFILPLFDTLRVFSIRIAQGKSPFKGDHQHIHHRMLELGFSHLQSTIILLSVNLAFIVVCYLLQDLGNVILIGIQFVFATLISYFLLLQVKKKTKNNKSSNLAGDKIKK
jgi:UDP-N-acetylmuramyl pentapeptide phosphotransferase/UDP-N-acetylglucosamine-1-phosphate transferase